MTDNWNFITFIFNYKTAILDGQKLTLVIKTK
jgi:hypothetical protein